VSCSSRVEWLPILHSLAMFHTTVCLRKDVYMHAWTTDFSWSHVHFMVSYCLLLLVVVVVVIVIIHFDTESNRLQSVLFPYKVSDCPVD